MLPKEPSFCIYNSDDGVEEVKGNQDLVDNDDGQLVRTVTIGENISYTGSGDFSFGKRGRGLIEEDEHEADIKDNENERVLDESEPVISPIYLATGYEVDGNGVNSRGVDFAPSDFDGNGDVEEYYKRVRIEDPSNPLFLRNYAQLLQSKGDLSAAEHYYLQATLADPKDGDTLSQYAKLVWELHQDKDRSSDYFERAVHAAPESSHVLAAYASFLWGINDESEDETNTQSDKNKIEETEEATVSRNLDYEEDNRPVSCPLHLAAGLGIGDNIFGGGFPVDYTVAVSDMSRNSEEYYMRMIKENPHNPVLLRNYAQFLSQSKGDLSAAEHYYLQATLADPKDGDTLSQYAKLVWELHQDKDRSSDYFERAVHATPESSHVLAAYASFLWGINDESGDETNTQSDKHKIEETEEATVSQNPDYEEDNRPVSSPLHLAAGLGIGDNIFGCGSAVDYTVAVSDMSRNSGEYYMRMIKENPHNPVLLRNYAQFLSQSKGDLQGAEEYYSRAILADPTDGETISHYAMLTWELHRDKYKASSYFQRAVQASPEDSDVLAAYARFLWQTEEDEDENIRQQS